MPRIRRTLSNRKWQQAALLGNDDSLIEKIGFCSIGLDLRVLHFRQVFKASISLADSRQRKSGY